MARTGRIFRDSDGEEWEVYDEGVWNAALAMIDFPVQTDNPGLLFISSHDMRRMRPRPEAWADLSDDDLTALCRGATSLL
ncbi:MAG: hypothetical protein NVS1B4_00930 [Gemmatimonadaceae bacterium]